MLPIGRYLRTVRHLRPSQLAWRVRYRLQRRLEERAGEALERKLTRGAAPTVVSPPSFPAPPCGDEQPRRRSERLEEIQRGELTLLGQTHPFAGGDDWRHPPDGGRGRLWTFTMHYHEWLLDLLPTNGGQDAADGDEEAARLLHELLEDWLESCPPGVPGFTDFAWNSFTTATRIRSWARLLTGPRAFWAERPELREELVRSMAMQATYLSGHIEWDIRGNHLLRDAVGLAWAGRTLTHPDSARWLSQAADLATDQAEEQLLPDGGHMERSPAYQVHVMDDLLDLATLLPDPPVRRRLAATWERMAKTLVWLRHPDGEVALFNDAAMGMAADPGSILACGSRIGAQVDAGRPSGGLHLPYTGLVVWHGDPWSVFFDVGEVGAASQPGHAHADTLSVEASFGGRRLIVDPGTFAYDRDARRRYDRSTASHNTVTVDGEDSTEVWHIFRVGRRARPLDVVARVEDGGITAQASHDGFDRLEGRPRHERTLRVRDHGAVEIVDRIRGAGEHEVEGGFLLDPEWQVEEEEGGWLLSHPAGSAVRVLLEGPEAVVRSTAERPYHPRLGVELMAPRLTWHYRGELPCRVQIWWEAVAP